MGHVRISLSGERTGRSDFIISVFDGMKVRLPSSNDGFVKSLSSPLKKKVLGSSWSGHKSCESV